VAAREDYDEDFERYLREFRPTAPGALPGVRRAVPSPWRLRVALAAAIIVVCSLAAWFFVGRKRSPRASERLETLSTTLPFAHAAGPPDVSLARLTVLMRKDPSELDNALMDISQRLLPNVENPRGTLHALAGE